jgi:hypothetical protein
MYKFIILSSLKAGNEILPVDPGESSVWSDVLLSYVKNWGHTYAHNHKHRKNASRLLLSDTSPYV